MPARYPVPARPCLDAGFLNGSSPVTYRVMRLTEEPVRGIERAVVLDRPAGWVHDLAQRVLRDRRIKDALHGSWLGHPLHPVLAQLCLGSFLSPACWMWRAGPGTSPAA